MEIKSQIAASDRKSDKPGKNCPLKTSARVAEEIS